MKTLKKWGKPVTSVQVFTPQEYVAGCGESEVPALKADCGAGIAGSPYAEHLAPVAGKTIEVKLKNEQSLHEWYTCPQKHIVTLDELKSGNMDVVWIGYTYPEYWEIDNPQNLYGYVENGAAHIFYIDLDNISSEIEKLPMS